MHHPPTRRSHGGKHEQSREYTIYVSSQQHNKNTTTTATTPHHTTATANQNLSRSFPSKTIIYLQATTMSINKSDAAPPVGGIKGFFLKAGKSFTAGATLGREWSWWLVQKGGTVGLFLASTSMVILMPLIFEINREVQVFMCVCMFVVVVVGRWTTIARHGNPR
jgi:uncharacterized membrane protein (UPF0136 family)